MIRKIVSTSFAQKVLSRLNRHVLQMMNYANNGDYRQSGELRVLSYISKQSAGSNHVIFDVGGNKGGYAQAIHSVFGDTAIIHAFEPSAETFAIFKSNTTQIPNLVANHLGMGESETTLTLYSNSAGSGLASVYDRQIGHYGITLDKTETISITTLDRYCRENAINEILLLKLDIEGHELSALKGAATMLGEKRIRYIQFECGGTNIDSRTYFKDFFDLLGNNYRIYRILKNGLFEIRKYSELNEVFLSVNYLAVLK